MAQTLRKAQLMGECSSIILTPFDQTLKRHILYINICIFQYFQLQQINKAPIAAYFEETRMLHYVLFEKILILALGKQGKHRVTIKSGRESLRNRKKTDLQIHNKSAY